MFQLSSGLNLFTRHTKNQMLRLQNIRCWHLRYFWVFWNGLFIRFFKFHCDIIHMDVEQDSVHALVSKMHNYRLSRCHSFLSRSETLKLCRSIESSVLNNNSLNPIVGRDLSIFVKQDSLKVHYTICCENFFQIVSSHEYQKDVEQCLNSCEDQRKESEK